MTPPLRTWCLEPGSPLRGRVRVPGDKSISHRALLLNALGHGRAEVRGLLDSADVQATRRVLEALGVRISGDPAAVVVEGRGGELSEPEDVLDCGNSGTTMRLMAGVLAARPFFSVLTGDASLRGRPMGRVADPLRQMGAAIDGRAGGGRAPLAIRGSAGLRCRELAVPVASAQVKSALLLAGLGGVGRQRVAVGTCRDHTERMLGSMGVAIQVGDGFVALEGGQRLRAVDVDVPGDISSAAFLLVAASVVPGSHLVIEDVGLNPTRTGALDVLLRMGADITVEGRRDVAGEPRGDLVVRHAPLRGARIGGDEIPRLIDELPVLAVAAAAARGETLVSDAAELRVKESDRVATTAAFLSAMGGRIEARPDGFLVEGGQPLSGAAVDAAGDHRIAMAAAVAALSARGETRIAGADAVAVSFPGFPAMLEALRRGG